MAAQVDIVVGEFLPPPPRLVRQDVGRPRRHRVGPQTPEAGPGARPVVARRSPAASGSRRRRRRTKKRKRRMRERTRRVRRKRRRRRR